MNWEIIALFIGLIVNLLMTIDGRRKSVAERDKLEAETASLYAKMAAESAARETNLKADIVKLEKQVKDQNRQIEELREIIDQKDGRIKELEDLTHKQEAEIRRLRSELDQMKK